MKKSFFDLFGKDVLDFFTDKESPVYLYSEKQIQENIRNIYQAANAHFDDFRLQFAVKANGNPHLLKVIQKEGVGADCSSPVELLLAKKMDFPMRKSTYTGNYESHADFEVACNEGAILNLDNGHRIEEVCKIKKPKAVSFRINPGVGRGSHEGIVTAGEKAKFGIPHEETQEVYQKAIDLGIKRFGIHMMTGSNVLDAEYFSEITEKLFDIIEEHILPLGIKLEFINIGGGLGVPYRKEEEPLDLEKTFAGIAEVYKRRLAKLNIGNPALAMEPGRFVVANAGHLLSRVLHIKKSYRNFLGIDASMSQILRPAMYQAYHEVEVLNSSNDKEDYYVCGQVCENSDVFPEKRKTKKAQIGDWLAIHDVGAYGHVMSSNYNHRTRPAEYLYQSDGTIKLIRKKEEAKDIFNGVPDFQW